MLRMVRRQALTMCAACVTARPPSPSPALRMLLLVHSSRVACCRIVKKSRASECDLHNRTARRHSASPTPKAAARWACFEPSTL
eukprot:365621-Chlamydomonas_euryale.AAC.13